MSRRKVIDYASRGTAEPGGRMGPRGIILLVGIGIFLFTFFMYAGSAWAAALYRLLVDGPLVALWVAAMWGVGVWVSRLFVAHGERVGFAGEAALGMGCFSLIILMLGLAGGMNRVVAWILLWFGLALAGVRIFGWGKIKSAEANPTNSQSSVLGPQSSHSVEWLWVLVAPFLAVAVLGALMPPGLLWGDEPNGYDVVEYHLQVPREWYEAGRMLPLRHNVFSYFPFNVEAHYWWAMELRGGPWAGMYLAQLMHVAMVVLSVAALVGFTGRSGIAGAIFAAATPWLALLAPVAYNEGGVLLFGTLAVGWAWRAMTRSEGRGKAMALAGVMAGFAGGAKLTGVPMLMLGIPIAHGVGIIARKQKSWLRPGVIFGASALVVLSPWLIRNFVWARNPVFPEGMSLLGRGHLSADQAERWRLAYVPTPEQRAIGGRAKAAWEQIFSDWRYGFMLIPAGLFAFSRWKMRAESLFLMALLVMWMVFWLFFTHLQSRFFVLAIPVLGLSLSRVESPIAKLALACAIVLQAGFGMLKLHEVVMARIVERSAVMGLEHYEPILDERIGKAMHGNGSLLLVGDAKAFYYEVPMARLRYRTVFDVDAAGQDVVDAWSNDWTRSAGDTLVIDFDEIRRFSWKESRGTGYWKIPAPAPDESGRAIVGVEK